MLKIFYWYIKMLDGYLYSLSTWDEIFNKSVKVILNEHELLGCHCVKLHNSCKGELTNIKSYCEIQQIKHCTVKIWLFHVMKLILFSCHFSETNNCKCSMMTDTKQKKLSWILVLHFKIIHQTQISFTSNGSWNGKKKLLHWLARSITITNFIT